MHPRILIVEDDPDVRDLLSVKLSTGDVPTMFNVTGIGVMDMIEDFKPDAVVLDIQLPGKNGFEILEEIKSDPTTKAIPVIMFSNFGSEEDKQRAKALGAEAFFVKAVTGISEFVQEVLKIANPKQA